ncbi:hypothetical protein J3Q64DRAFT_1756605 [Phycomyces blakesleeanus]|uniref:Copper transporter n=1 Tax=Phycomyces blakesleeanus TaxID=4837 RepID=A0ABR3ARV9_PHYBL
MASMSGKLWFHSEVQNVHLLFESFTLDSPLHLGLGYLLVVAICWAERAITYWLDGATYKGKKLWPQILLKTTLYGIVMTLRLLYMLICMYFNTGLFITIIFALTSGQLVFEFKKSSKVSNLSGGAGYKDRRNDYGYATRPEEETQHLFVPQDEYELAHDMQQTRVA